MSISVWFKTLASTSKAWDAQAEDLHGSRNSLLGADTSALGSRVAPVAKEFQETWLAELESAEADAEDYAATLIQVKAQWAFVDQATVEATQKLLGWSDRDTEPFGED